MTGVGMSFEQAPPVSVPLRFFLTAPLFGVLAAGVLVAEGEAVFASRWTGAALAVVHLFTVGMLLQIMLGALFQVLPVAAGANLWRPAVLAGWVHPASTLGALLLAVAFLSEAAWAYRAAATCLLAALLPMAWCATLAVWRTPASGPTLWGLRGAVVGLALTVALGVPMALARGGDLSAAWLGLSALHQAWGLAGWGLALLASVAYLVVPMFLLTPPYPQSFARAFVPLLLLCLALAGWLGGGRELALAVALLATGFALGTLRLQQRRRRAVADACLGFWRLSMASMLVAAGLACAAALDAGPGLETLAGVLVLVGVLLSVMLGMLYKIVPFILWLCMQRQLRRPPAMTRLVAEPRQLAHLRLHAATLGLLLAACVWPLLAWPGGLALGASSLLLGDNLRRALGSFREAMRSAPPVGAARA